MKSNTDSLFQFMWKKAWWQMILTLIFIIGGITLFISIDEPFSMHLYVIISTFIIAIFIWYNERLEDWEDSLPKKLDVVYLLKTEPDPKKQKHTSVKNAPLTGESDIRQWGQSIAKTVINEKANIDFSGFFVEKAFRDKKRNVMVFSITIFLRKPILGLKFPEYIFDDDGNLIQQKEEPSTADV